MRSSVLLVGSVPGDNAEEVLRLTGKEVGKFVTSLSDGETGYRQQWVQCLAARVYAEHPNLEIIQRPQTPAGEDKWHNESYGEKGWLFKVRDGIKEIHFPDLGYAASAIDSYAVFKALRKEGVIPENVKFQVSLPLTESGTRIFVTNDHDYQLISSAYENAMILEIERVLANIPANDLVIQWDLALEVLYIVLQGKTPWEPTGNTFERYLQSLNRLAAYIPAATIMGCHYCFGDLGHKHLLEPPDLGLPVQMANAAVKKVGRSIDYIHMPVPRNRNDNDYFTPLNGLATGDAKLFLGLIHYTDGVAGSLRRIKAAQNFVSDFGVATECGFGRRAKDTVPDLLRIHREVAETLQ